MNKNELCKYIQQKLKDLIAHQIDYWDCYESIKTAIEEYEKEE